MGVWWNCEAPAINFEITMCLRPGRGYYEKNGIVLAKKEVGAMYVRQSGRMTEAIMLEVVQQLLEKICVRTVETRGAKKRFES